MEGLFMIMGKKQKRELFIVKIQMKKGLIFIQERVVEVHKKLDI